VLEGQTGGYKISRDKAGVFHAVWSLMEMGGDEAITGENRAVRSTTTNVRRIGRDAQRIFDVAKFR
jgi:hypothetical protein